MQPTISEDKKERLMQEHDKLEDAIHSLQSELENSDVTDHTYKHLDSFLDKVYKKLHELHEEIYFS